MREQLFSPIKPGLNFEALEGYQYTIDLFNEALGDTASWPTDDHATKQHFQSDLPPTQQVIKSGWGTAVFLIIWTIAIGIMQ